jgi:hypothetical protein
MNGLRPQMGPPAFALLASPLVAAASGVAEIGAEGAEV